MKEDENNDSWELIYSTDSPYKAAIIKGALEAENIQCVVINKQDSSYLIFGEVEIYVKQDEVLLAKHILNKEIVNE